MDTQDDQSGVENQPRGKVTVRAVITRKNGQIVDLGVIAESDAEFAASANS